MKSSLILFSLLIAHHVSAQVFPENKQLVLVVTEGWEKSDGWMYRYARQDDGSWKMSPIDPIPVVIGRLGMAWGEGLYNEADIPPKTPLKVEGDGKAPAGMFAFGTAFGYDELKEVIKLGKLKLTPTIECVDDVESSFYNKMIDRKTVSEVDWKRSEVMRRKDELYRYGIVIEHNTSNPIQKGKGSCIFLHVWDGPGTSTSGCTATHEYNVRSIMEWLDPGLRPVLVQLPWREYVRLKKKWNLPEITKKFAL